jgi:hypothetical protein
MSLESAVHRLIDTLIAEHEQKSFHREADETPEQTAKRNEPVLSETEQLRADFDALVKQHNAPTTPVTPVTPEVKEDPSA